MRPKTKLFAVKFRRILNVLCLQVYRKGSGHNFTICASRNEAICPEIQTHFGSSPLASLTEKVLGAITQFVRPKMKLFAVKFRRIFKITFMLFSRNLSNDIFGGVISTYFVYAAVLHLL